MQFLFSENFKGLVLDGVFTKHNFIVSMQIGVWNVQSC